MVYRNAARQALIEPALKQLASSSMFLVQNHSCRRGSVEDGFKFPIMRLHYNTVVPGTPATLGLGLSNQLILRMHTVMAENILNVNDDSFDEDVLNSDMPVLIDYWAEWCSPCKMIAPTLEEVASEYQGRVKVAKLNIDDNPGTPPKYGIRSIPTLMLFKSGQVEATKVGAVSKAQLTAFLDENL